MAVIKQYEQKTGELQVPRQIPHPHIVPVTGIGPGVAELGAGLANLSLGLKRKEEEDGKAWAAQVLSQARVDAAEDLQRRQVQAEPGAPDFTPQALTAFDEYSSKALEGAPSESAAKFARERFAALRAEVGTHAVTFQAQAGVDFRSDQYKAGVDNAKKLMNLNPDQYSVTLAEQLAILSVADIPPIKKSALEAEAVNGISQAAVWSQIQRSPSAFLNSIGFDTPTGDKQKARLSSGDLTARTGNMAFDALPFEQRVHALNQALQAKNQIDIDLDRTSKARADQLRADALKQAYGLNADGKLTRQFVEDIRPLITPDEYRGVLTMIKGGAPSFSDKQAVYLIETTMATDPRQAQKMLHNAFNNGQLEQGYYTSALGRAETRARQGGPKTEYEMSREYIRGQLDPGPLIQDPVARGRMADALDTFDRWVGAGQRSDVDIQKRGREIVNQYKFVDLSDQVFALPMPRSGKIRRQPADVQGMKADIAAAAERAQARRDARMLTPEEYDDEVKILARWIRAIEGNTNATK